MSLPYFPMFPSDFEAKTSHLTLVEDGAYNRLLRICWMSPGCSMPNDEAWVMRRARAITVEEQGAVRSVLAEFFTVENGRFSNARLAREWLAANEAHEKRKNAGAMGGKAKSLKTKKTTSSNALAKPKQPEPEPEPYNKPPKSPKGECIHFSEFWAAYPACKRKTDKPKARVLFAKLIEGKHPHIDKTEPEKIISGVKAYAATAPDQEFIPLPTTWLNGERWTVAHLPSESERAKKYGNYV